MAAPPEVQRYKSGNYFEALPLTSPSKCNESNSRKKEEKIGEMEAIQADLIAKDGATLGLSRAHRGPVLVLSPAIGHLEKTN